MHDARTAPGTDPTSAARVTHSCGRAIERLHVASTETRDIDRDGKGVAGVELDMVHIAAIDNGDIEAADD